ncbi:ATP-dependent DNA helicase [Trichonephila clavipes]|nr:ATP-dependent DNA helicase [Trichonephila clavipes]
MGGILVLLAGDFRPTLSVIQRAIPADEIRACIKSSNLWAKVEKFSLKTNMRVHLHNDVDSGYYAKTLLKIGDRCLEGDAEETSAPAGMDDNGDSLFIDSTNLVFFLFNPFGSQEANACVTPGPEVSVTSVTHRPEGFV